MIREFSIKNYKSLLELKLELGRINLFIGENGCGKTNILEAMAMAAAAVSGRLDTEELYNRGVRVAKPTITLSSFAGTKQSQEIVLTLECHSHDRGGRRRWKVRLGPPANDTMASGWEDLEAKAVREQANALLKDPAFAGPVMPADQPDFDLSGLDESQRWTLLDSIRAIRASTTKEQRTAFFSRNILAAELGSFLIYNANQLALRGLLTLSRKEPLGINGENLDVAIASLGDTGIPQPLQRSALIRWVEPILTDPEDKLKFEGYKLGRSASTLYFRDRFMRKRANIFSAENANEGILHALFYLTLFISDRTPKTFGIDNIETALNPRLCRNLVKQLGELAKVHDKQALITTHNPAALDGLDLHDDDQRLFVVARNDAGQTVANRIKLKPETKGKESRLMLSEMWMRGQLGGIPLEF